MEDSKTGSNRQEALDYSGYPAKNDRERAVNPATVSILAAFREKIKAGLVPKVCVTGQSGRHQVGRGLLLCMIQIHFPPTRSLSQRWPGQRTKKLFAPRSNTMFRGIQRRERQSVVLPRTCPLMSGSKRYRAYSTKKCHFLLVLYGVPHLAALCVRATPPKQPPLRLPQAAATCLTKSRRAFLSARNRR